MIFGEVRVGEALGCYLAHSLKTPAGKLRKGRKLTTAHVQQLIEGGFDHVTVAQLEACDVHEDQAAMSVATMLAGEGIRIGPASTGRVNLHALVDGVCDFDRELIDLANAVDEGITVATVMPSSAVGKGRLVATVKIIPYAVPEASVARVVAVFARRIQVHPSVGHRAFFIQTQLPTIKESVLDKTSHVTRQRLLTHHAQMLGELRVPHTEEQLASAMVQGMHSGADWVLVAGASAIADRQDVIPAASYNATGRCDPPFRYANGSGQSAAGGFHRRYPHHRHARVCAFTTAQWAGQGIGAPGQQTARGFSLDIVAWSRWSAA